VDRLLKAFVEANAKYKELFSVLYTALGGLVGIILYRERKKYKAGADAAKVVENEKKIKEIGDKVEGLEDKVAAVTASVESCQAHRASLMAPVQARIEEMEKRLIYMLESQREQAKQEKEHEIKLLVAQIDQRIERMVN